MNDFDKNTNVALYEPSRYGEIRRSLSHTPSYSARSLGIYKKQLVETRTLQYHQHNLRLLQEKPLVDPVEKRNFVIKRVARELWTNFCVRGQETPMLHYLHTGLRKEFGEDLQFHYLPGAIELLIMKQGETELEAIDRMEQVNIVNRAWQISQEVVSSYAS